MRIFFLVIEKYLIYILFFLLLIISLPAFYDSFNSPILKNNYSFNELFINYQSGFIRRGLLGEIFYQIYQKLQINPVKIWAFIFLFLHLILISFYFFLLKKWKKYSFLLIIIIFSPALNLFYIYDREVYFIKDIFSNLTIFLHSLIASSFILNRITIEKYYKFLRFLIIPFLIFSLLIHELQLFYIPIHILISFICFKKKSEQVTATKKILKIYTILIVPIIILFLFRGSEPQSSHIIQQLEAQFGINIHSQIYAGKNYGTFLTLLGNFFVWHFYYLYPKVIIIFIFSFLFSVVFLYWLFEYLLEKKIIKTIYLTDKIYKKFFLICLIPFFLTDHGRAMSLFSNHIVAFFLMFNINENNYFLLKKKIDKNFIQRKIIILAIFFYICLWTLSQTAGLKPGNQIDPVFETSLFTEIQTLAKRTYNFIRINFIYTLPKLPMHS
jgi:hypothetical protein